MGKKIGNTNFLQYLHDQVLTMWWSFLPIAWWLAMLAFVVGTMGYTFGYVNSRTEMNSGRIHSFQNFFSPITWAWGFVPELTAQPARKIISPSCTVSTWRRRVMTRTGRRAGTGTAGECPSQGQNTPSANGHLPWGRGVVRRPVDLRSGPSTPSAGLVSLFFTSGSTLRSMFELLRPPWKNLFYLPSSVPSAFLSEWK